MRDRDRTRDELRYAPTLEVPHREHASRSDETPRPRGREGQAGVLNGIGAPQKK